VACPTGVDGHCSAGVTYPTYTGFTLNLVEDFPAAVDLDKDPIFTWSDGSPESGQVRFREQEITFANGTMVITAESTCPSPQAACIPSSTSYAEPAYMSNSGTVAAMNVWSGEFRTKYNNYRYGRYEVRYQAPSPTPAYASNPGANASDGNFLSTMFIFRTPKWLTWNEIDLELHPDIPTSVAYNVVNATNQQHYPNNNNAAGNTKPITGYADNQMHTYAFEWLPTGITWYLDGNVLPVQTGANFPGYQTNGQYTGKTSDPVPTLSAKIMMNLWIFGSSAAFGDPSKNQYPFHATYDYFHFYKWDQETTYPCSPTPSCLPAADVKDSQNNPNEPNYPN
jgi:beta-glucanase (GH16 family)